ncbi:MAG: HlyC/CorC family transporter [Fimbriimonadaceae bacterium]|nr:HlyC/CorC family transporter [Fimbriimonadaceae bacterium]
MSSDPIERRRRTGLANAGWVGTLTVLLVIIPVLAAAQGLSAANRPEAIALLGNPAFTIGLIFAFVLIMLINAICVAGTAALETLRSLHVKTQDEGSRAFKVLESLLDQKENITAATVLGAQTMRAWLVLLCFLPAPALAFAFGWISLPTDANHFFWGSLFGAIVLSIPVMALNVIFAELVAKSVAATHPIDTLLRLGWILKIFNAIFRVPAVISVKIADLITQRFGTTARFVIDNRVEEEIKEILESVELADDIEEEERDLLNSVFEFGDTVAREIMTPRVDLESIPVESDLQHVAELVESTGHSRFPIFQDNDDEIVGIIHAKDVLRALARGQKDITIDQIMRPAHHVPEGKKLHDLLAEMRTNKTQMVIISDEFGGTAGIVTIEDIVEELVGEIIDEYDQETPDISEVDFGHSVSGKVHLDDLNDEIETSFASEEFDTIGGYVFGLFGRQPAVGEAVSDDTHTFTIEESDGRRIQRVRVEVKAQEAVEAD